MTAIIVAGGVYHEQCIWPDWDQIFGSGGRAAAALAGRVDSISLRTYARLDTAERFSQNANLYGFSVDAKTVEQTISFEYVHCLSVPTIRPAQGLIRTNDPLLVKGDVALRFGMMEGSAIVDVDWCVYDPQAGIAPQPFEQNGSRAKHLAIVGNRMETLRLAGAESISDAAQILMKRGAEVVVVKSGTDGAFIFSNEGSVRIPAYLTERVWSIGSGDVFAAIFTSEWAIARRDPVEAAQSASRAVAEYANTMALPIPASGNLAALPEATAMRGKVYLAGPFFSISQRWLVDEARQCLHDLGMNVFSPVHDIGHGLANEVAPADLKALDESDVIFAIVDGIDSGTLFEVGYARAQGKPVYALAQTVSEEDLKMLAGSGCKVHYDFTTALHHLVWRA